MATNFCSNCGTKVDPQYGICPNCGNELFQQPVYTTNVTYPQQYTVNINSKKDLLKLPQFKKLKTTIIICIVLCYINAITSLPTIVSGNYLGFLDMGVCITVAVLLQTKVSQVAAIVYLVYASIAFLLNLLILFTPAGVGAVAISIGTVIATSQVNKAWKSFKSMNPSIM